MNSIIVFSTVHYVFIAERLCRELAIPYQIISIPKELTTECGMCLEVNFDDTGRIKDRLELMGINYKIFHR